MLKRIIYLGYYVKELDKKKFSKFFKYVNYEYRIGRVKLMLDVLRSSIKYNISLLDYFYFKFYSLDDLERKKYAGTGFMYEYQLIMNPKNHRDILENKFLFFDNYDRFIQHKAIRKNDLINSIESTDEWLMKSNKIVLKSSNGQCGEGIEVLNLKELDRQDFVKRLEKTSNDMIEEFIVQHNELMKLSASGLNTIRIFTQLDDKGEVDILGARLRITIDSYVDNLAAGNIAAPIDVVTGNVNGPGVYSDITKNDEENHPISNTKIVGFTIPYWFDSLQMVKEAALLHPQNKSIGWDVAITNNGPELLEGNHNWCKLLWQLPVKKGLKSSLDKYL